MSFFTFLEARIQKVDSRLCVGLDPHPEDLAELSAQAAFDFCRHLIDKTSDLAAAYKPNSAFFEALGPDGMTSLKKVIRMIDEDIPVILDVKRGDISSTARAYAQACFDVLGADAVTISPYLGSDAVQPFLEDPQKGVFVLCKTSNPGAKHIQDLPARGGYLYEHVADLARSWNEGGNLGLVVGATQVDSLVRVRARAPELWIMSPGVGAQGGNLKEAVRAGLREDGSGLLVPVSRGISRAEDPRQAAALLRERINREVAAATAPGRKPDHDGASALSSLAKALLEAGCVKFGDFTLKSGIRSPIYIDLRLLASKPALLWQIAGAYVDILRELHFDHLAALPYAAMPIASAISLQGNWPMIYPRKEKKSYGTKARVEGLFSAGDKAVVIDDLITTGGSKIEGIDKLTSVGVSVEDVVVLIDRQSGGRERLADHGMQLRSVFDLPALLSIYERDQLVEKNKITRVRDFLSHQRK